VTWKISLENDFLALHDNNSLNCAVPYSGKCNNTLLLLVLLLNTALHNPDVVTNGKFLHGRFAEAYSFGPDCVTTLLTSKFTDALTMGRAQLLMFHGVSNKKSY